MAALFSRWGRAAYDWAARRRLGGPVGAIGLPVVLGVTLGAAGAAFPPSRDAAIALYDQTRYAVLTRPEYRIRWVEITGAPRVGDAEIVAALDLTEDRRAALGFDAAAARRRVEALGWVERADVFVRPPQTLEIRITERTPAALWRRGDRLELLDASGALIDALKDAEREDGRWAHLPLFVGQGARASLSEGLHLRRQAEDAGLGVLAMTRVGGRRWDMALTGGLRVMLPERAPTAALRDVVAWTARADLLRRGFSVVDLRIPFAPTARLADGAAPPTPEVTASDDAASAVTGPAQDG